MRRRVWALTAVVLLPATVGCGRGNARALAALDASEEPQPSASTPAPATPSASPLAAAQPENDPPPTDPPCAEGMALIEGRFCIDRWEASLIDDRGAEHTPYEPPGPTKVAAASRPDVTPQAYISLGEADRACARAGKKLCTTQQWVDACMGSKPPKRTFPYGNIRQPTACNDSYRGHPVDRLLPGKGRPRDVLTLNDPRINQLPSTVSKTGTYPACVTPDGVYDLIGNLLEWTRGPRPLLMGGHYVDSQVNGQGCTYVTMDHDAQYHDFTTGFRCCMEPRHRALPAAAPPTSSGAASPSARSFDNPWGALPTAPPPAAYDPADAKCPSDMVLVEGVRCGLAQQECLRWVDPPGGLPQRACGEFSQPTVCRGVRQTMRFCIDRTEFTAPGERLPLVHVSFSEAELLCRKQQKRMCDEREWEFACEGPEALPFPYGYLRDGPRCNHDLDNLFVAGKLVDQRVAADARLECRSPFGVLNLVGNVDEWCQRAGSQFPWRAVLKGGWWLTGRNRCRAVTDSHNETYAGPQTGFRCCRESRR